MRAPAAIATLALLVLVYPEARAELLDPPYDVYEAGPLERSALGAVRYSLDPWKILHQESSGDGTWLLLALPDGEAGADLPGWGRPRYLGRVRRGERLAFLAPQVPSQERLRSGRAITIAPSNGTVVVSAETPHELAQRMAHSFRLLERALPVPQSREPGPLAGFRGALERARRAGEGDMPRTAAEVQNLIDAVSPDSLENHVRAMSETGQNPSRYYARDETRGTHKAYIEQHLGAALGAGNVTNHAVRILHPDGDREITVYNIVGRLPSALPGAGAFLLTAHYDAIGKNTDPLGICDAGLRLPSSGCDCAGDPASISADPDCAWDWEDDPAPGADDNATGVAALLEAARILAPVAFDFDIYFVAFQAEEQGLVGSAAFADSVAAAGQEVYGVVNLDMIGYNAARNRADVITNETSEWLADFILETSETFVPSLPVEKHVVFFGRSDHASFWSNDVDAVLVIEDIDLEYPAYHTILDIWDNTFPPPPDGRPNSELQFQLVSQLAVGTLARFGVHYETPDLALPAGELEARPFSGEFATGQSILLTARVHNYGTSSLFYAGTTTDSLTARVSFYDGDPDEGAPLISQIDRTDYFPSGGVVTVQTTWTPADDQEGFHDVHAVVEGLDTGYAQTEASDRNNETSTRFFVRAPAGSAPEILTHHLYPNPVTGRRDELTLYFELTRDASRLTVDVFDLVGQAMGQFQATDQFIGNGNQAEANRVAGHEFRWNGPDLASGVYVYSIRCFGSGGALTDVGEGKFAVAR